MFFLGVSIVNLAFESLPNVKHSLYFSSLILCLLMFAYVCIYLFMFTSISFCLPLSKLCLCLPLFAYVYFYLLMLVYLLLSPKLCELLSFKFCLFSKFFSFPIHYHVVVYYLVTNVYLGPLEFNV
jgi:hypothetical protein